MGWEGERGEEREKQEGKGNGGRYRTGEEKEREEKGYGVFFSCYFTTITTAVRKCVWCV